MIVLLSPYHDQCKPDAALPQAPPGVLGKGGHLLDLTVTATLESDVEQIRGVDRRVDKRLGEPDHMQIEAALIGPKDWLMPRDIIRYRRDRIDDLREQGKEAADATWNRIQQHGWDSLQG